MNNPSLYIHIPFCKKICPYCDFHKMVASTSLQNKYIDSLIIETKLKELNKINFKSIYIGGGTPSSLSIDNIIKLLDFLNNYINFSYIKEFTFEINVEDIYEDLLKALKKYNVNRLSIGIQTFNDNLQHLINRVHSYSDIKNKIKLLNTYFDNYSIDLMYALPNEDLSILKDDLEKTISLNPKHISTYCLIKEEHTIFNHQNINEIDEKLQEEMYFFINDYLVNKGFNKYETSNYSLNGYESIHNLSYWNLDDYYSLGSGASAFVNNVHYKTTTKILEYIDSLSKNNLPNILSEKLQDTEIIDEFISMSLRKTIGIKKKDFYNKFNYFIDELFDYSSLLAKNYIIENNDFIFINNKYFFVQNNIIVKFLCCRR